MRRSMGLLGNPNNWRRVKPSGRPARRRSTLLPYAAAMPGIVSYGAYLPYWRLQRGAIGQSLGSGGGKGTRSVASYDEDTTSMGVEAGRLALAAAPAGLRARAGRLRHDRAGVRRQDQRHGHPRRARPADDVPALRRRRRHPLRCRRGVDGPGRRRARRAVRHPHRPAGLGRRGRRRRRRRGAGVRRPRTSSPRSSARRR